MGSNLPATEEVYPSIKQIDHLDTKSAFNLMLEDQMKVYKAIRKNEKLYYN